MKLEIYKLKAMQIFSFWLAIYARDMLKEFEVGSQKVVRRDFTCNFLAVEIKVKVFYYKKI